MRYVRLILTIFCVFAMLFLCSSCAMLPEEEVYSKAPIIREQPVIDYKMVYVLRGDIFNTESISCRYRAVKEETLFFRVGDEFFDEIYVGKGDSVKAGDVLAELQMGDINERIDQLEYSLRSLSLELTHAKENMQNAIERQRVYLADIPKEHLPYEQTVADVEGKWLADIGRIEDQLYLDNLRLEEYREAKVKRQVIATIDGTVTYMRTVREGDKSIEGERFVKIADATNSVFVGETRNYRYLTPGDLVEITVSKVVYPAVVTSAEELGIQPSLDPENERREVFFLLLQPATELEAGDRGTLSIIMDEREDALYVVNNAIVTADGKTAVYVKDEFGLKSLRYVETGLKTAKVTEIISGLSEGEAVIIK